ncbi:hypothetical protein Sinac_2174 [Singulisphaera acidiphila DSM 18658]|uniref:Uncharacterized protein n=1 Tax=Singulisphaera acidiphila (strain ATCC BAA-1392 / DSM 18658 / VKM B-2454 / MOB10) TaxID=886293 RepID=L0DCY0_SINAD|nr:hypothetical protein Sinac_2174 [Singulisphaera acidiphila DSM 18658]
MPVASSLSRSQLDAFVRDVNKAIGTTGDERHKLCFAVGPLCFDMSDDETRQFIRDAFAAARENDVAVAFHIDDSMTWGRRKDLLSNPENIETAGWDERPNTGRRADWGPIPTKFPPQMVSARDSQRGGDRDWHSRHSAHRTALGSLPLATIRSFCVATPCPFT